ncbi:MULTISPECIES: MFS transporter [unclassified Shewanella]|uniref:MFS transporter n=2 Tax=Shewanellaceae TaxID=267890 RepID=UPI0021DB0D92|nr:MULTISPECIES: MFS transporter [unclassified Shewanella]MCU8021785.1 MFS transporter [Shewanella sp. SM78]MCU8034510.1 MFS transporter [Shewanella sp. SM71]MCU8043498.1 MFS transporter [Shewanella sp. SM68]MCU8048760.1 MFS transporter [Shewanella sp. SM65]MCU8071701.1 MFS transporter [Shewanella sp. SM32]
MFRYLLCSFCLVLLYPTGIDMYLIGLPQIAQDLGASEAQLHIAFSVYLAGMATTMLFAGSLADRIGRKPITLFGAFLFAIASYFAGSAQTSDLFLMARFAQGIGAGSCYVVAFAILRDVLDDKRRAKVLSMVNGVTCIIPVIAPVIGHLIMLKFPWPSLFNTMAGMGLMVLTLCIFVLRETYPKPQLHTTVEPGGYKESFKQRFFLSRVVITTLGVTTILSYVNVSPMLIMGQMGFDRGQYSNTMAMTAFVSMVASFSTPFLLNLFKEKSLILFSQTLFAAAALVLILTQLGGVSQSFNLLGFSFVCSGFAIGFGVTMSQALSPFVARAGVASSLLGIAQVCTSALYIWVMGLLEVSAINILLVILAVGALVSITLILAVPKLPEIVINDQIPESARS